MNKRERDDNHGSDVPNKRREGSFLHGTTEVEWTSTHNEDRKYIIRYVNKETCCESPWEDQKDWPTCKLVSNPGEVADEGADPCFDDFNVIGAVWTNSGEFVAVWASDPGDGHIEFYGKEGYEWLDDLEDCTGDLCHNICTELKDVFDDGSGTTREVTKVPASYLDCVYLQHFHVSVVSPN